MTGKNIDYYKGAIWIPIAIYLVLTRKNKVPVYLWFLIGFTIFHLISVYVFDLVSGGPSKWIMYLLADMNVTACLIFFIIENTRFEDVFMRRMNRNILIVVIISTIVSIIQTSDPYFMFNFEADKDLEYIGESRTFSIYSWININSMGITFPILISLLLNAYDTRNRSFPIIVVSGIVVAFLSRARYIMISTIIAFSQLFMNSAISIKKKIAFILILVFSLLIMIRVAENFGFDINQVIEERILEKENEMGSAKSRLTSLTVFMIKFPEHPWFGVGPETRDDVIRLLGGEAPLIHVGYLSYLYFYGIAGSLLLFLSIFFLMRDGWKVGRRFNFWGSFYGLITFCLANATFVYFNLGEVGIVLSVLYIKYYRQVAEEEDAEEEEMDYLEEETA